MKIKVKIWGLDETDGSRRTFTRTVDCPDFVDTTDTFMGHTLTTTVDDQIDAWILDNWKDVVVKSCEERFIHPIIDCKLVPTKAKVNKKKEVIDLLGRAVSEWDDGGKAIVLGTLSELWPTIKNQSVVQIAKTVLGSVGVSSMVGAAYFRDIKERIIY